MKNGKLNREFLDQYKSVFADQLISQAYEGKTHLSGKDILQITPLKQFNLFVLKILFTAWQEEMKQLESPYFDYKNAEVRRNMVQFMNELSQHIKVKSEHLKPLILQAVERTFELAVNPAAYLRSELGDKTGVLREKLAKQTGKYVVFHKEEIHGFLDQYIGHSIDKMLEDANEFFDNIDKDTVIDDLVEGVSEILVVERRDLFFPSVAGTGSLDTEEVMSDIDDDEEIDFENDENFQEGNETDVDTNPEVTDIDDNDQLVDEVKREISAEVTEQEPLEDEEAGQAARSNDDEDLVSEEPEVGPMSDSSKELFDSISMNHRYMFVQELFDGDNEVFTQAIEGINERKSFDEAVEFLVQAYSKDFYWDMNSDEVKELLKVVFRRFR